MISGRTQAEGRAGAATVDPAWRVMLASRPLPLAAALLSFGAAAIHFGVAPDHFAEFPLYGVFFASLGWFQVLWGAAYLVRPEARLGVLAAVVNIAVVLVWIYSRTVGLPIGPNPGSTEVLGVADSISSAFEILLAIGIVAELTLLRGTLAQQTSRRQVAAALIVAAAVVAATVVALVALAPSNSMG